MYRNLLIGAAMIGATALLVIASAARSEEDARPLRGMMCDRAADVPKLVQLLIDADGSQPLQAFLASVPDDVKCEMTIKMVRFVDTSPTTIAGKPYSILHFKDTDGKDVYSWERLPGDPA